MPLPTLVGPVLPQLDVAGRGVPVRDHTHSSTNAASSPCAAPADRPGGRPFGARAPEPGRL
jgi:hypothetical protein